MSDFECAQHHPMKPSDGPWCLICGSRVAYMDGKTSRELEKEEEMEGPYDYLDEENEELWDAFCETEDEEEEEEDECQEDD